MIQKAKVPTDPKTGKTLYQKVTSEEVEELDELSRATVGRYAQKAKSIADNEGGKDRTKGRELAGRKRWGGTMSGVKKAKVMATEESELEESLESMSDARVKYHATKNFPHGRYTDKEIKAEHERRRKSVPNYHAVKPSMNEEQIDELSKKTLGNYVKKAAGHAAGSAAATAAIASSSNPKVPEKTKRDLRNRMKGISKATDKMVKEDIDAVKKLNESYKIRFNAALEHYNIKSPSELGEEQRKEFFQFVDQEFKKGDN
jgi:hypothetical protein